MKKLLRILLLAAAMTLGLSLGVAETLEEIDARFAAQYGDPRYWTLEARHEWDMARVAAGVGDRLYYVLPGERDLSLNEAIAVTEKEIHDPEWGKLKHYDAAAVDLSAYRLSYSFLEYEDGERMYWIRYYSDAYSQPIFEAQVFQSGAATVNFYDAQSMQNVYEREIGKRGEKYAYWSLADKRAFYETLLKMFEREMAVYGDLPPFAKPILAREPSLPLPGEISEAEALALAREAVRDKEFPQNIKKAVSLYREAGREATYEITFVGGVTPLAAVLLSAVDGAIISKK